MVVHLCCSVDAGYFLERLKRDFPEERLIGYFFDPNIHPYSEFKLRSLDTERICRKLGVEFREGPYLIEEWFKRTAGLEEEPEKGSRCSICFDFSLEETARLAVELGESKITTSLLMSPMKSRSQIEETGRRIKERFGVEFIIPDYRKRGGTQAQQSFSKRAQLYRQNYCGCLYGLVKQRGEEGRIKEFASPINRAVLPSSVEERLQLYRRRIELEEEGRGYRILSHSFLNYRLLRGGLKRDGKPVPSHPLFYSHLPRPVRGYVEKVVDGVYYLNRGEVILLPLSRFNRELEGLGEKGITSVWELYRTPFSIDLEIEVRERITGLSYSLSPVLVVPDEVVEGCGREGEIIDHYREGMVRFEVELESLIFPDKKSVLREVEGGLE